MYSKFSKCLLVMFSIIMTLSISLQGADLLYELNTVFSGPGTPSGPTPWLTAEFNNNGDGTVRLQMSTNTLATGEFVSKWYFNYDPTKTVTDLSFSRVGSAPPGDPAISTGTNSFQADGDGKFDIEFSFQTSLTNRFGPSQSIIYDISSTSASLDVSLFDYISVEGGGAGTFNTAAHIQGLGSENEDSAWIANNGAVIPEPSTYFMLSTLIAIAAVAKKKRKVKVKTS